MNKFGEQSGHWYWPDGKPCYELENKSQGGLRRTNASDAKKLGLLPSVTSIIRVLDKPAINIYRQKQLLKAALSISRIEEESDDDYLSRVVDEADKEKNVASSEGEEIHGFIADHLLGKEYPGHTENVDRAMASFKRWAEEVDLDPQMVEFPFADTDLGFGGRMDCIAEVNGERYLIDWKTQATKPGKPINFYEDTGLQLAAYAKSFVVEKTMSLVVSRNEDFRYEAKTWSKGWEWDAFLNCRDIYYSPLGQGKNLTKPRTREELKEDGLS